MPLTVTPCLELDLLFLPEENSYHQLFYAGRIVSLCRNKILALPLVFLQNLEHSVWCAGSSHFSFLFQGVSFSIGTWHPFWTGICDHRWYSIIIEGNGHFCLQHLPFGAKNLFRLLSNPAQMQEYTRRIQQDWHETSFDDFIQFTYIKLAYKKVQAF